MDLNVTSDEFVRSPSEAIVPNEWWISLSYLVRDVSCVLVVNFILEFCMAQAPCQVRGLVSSVLVSSAIIFRLLNVVLDRYIPSNWVFYVVRRATSLTFFVYTLSTCV